MMEQHHHNILITYQTKLMALKELVTDLTQGLDSYPNHNTPSMAGGFNYGESTSIFDAKMFNQRSMGYADKFTSQDNPSPLNHKYFQE